MNAKRKEKLDVDSDSTIQTIPGDADNSSCPNSPFNNLDEVDEHATESEDTELSIADKKRLNDKG